MQETISFPTITFSDFKTKMSEKLLNECKSPNGLSRILHHGLPEFPRSILLLEEYWKKLPINMLIDEGYNGLVVTHNQDSVILSGQGAMLLSH